MVSFTHSDIGIVSILKYGPCIAAGTKFLGAYDNTAKVLCLMYNVIRGSVDNALTNEMMRVPNADQTVYFI